MSTYTVEFGLMNDPSTIAVTVEAPNSGAAISAAAAKAGRFGYDIDDERGCGVKLS